MHAGFLLLGFALAARTTGLVPGGKLGNSVSGVLYKTRDFNDSSGVLISTPIEPRKESMHYL